MTHGDKSALLSAERVLNAEFLAAAVAMRTEGKGAEAVSEADVMAEVVARQEGAMKLVWHHGNPDAALPDPVEALPRLLGGLLAHQLQGLLLLLDLLLACVGARLAHVHPELDGVQGCVGQQRGDEILGGFHQRLKQAVRTCLSVLEIQPPSLDAVGEEGAEGVGDGQLGHLKQRGDHV